MLQITLKGYENFPCWIWYQGYCYYYDQNGNYLTNTTTPDGYTVDELGRWTVNGNPIHNGAGNYKMHTEDYNGKSDDEIWSLMKEKLIPVYQDAIISWNYDGPDASGKQIHIDQYSYGYGDDIVWTDNDTSTYGGYGEMAITHNDQRFGTFVTASIGNEWSDLERTYNTAISKSIYSQKPDIKEKPLKQQSETKSERNYSTILNSMQIKRFRMLNGIQIMNRMESCQVNLTFLLGRIVKQTMEKHSLLK